MNQLHELITAIDAFRDERNWHQFHNAKDLSLSLSLEASELLEHFQWKTSEEALAGDQNGIEEELGDVLIYALMLCSDLGVDPEVIIRNKLKLNESKYPVEKSHGRREKYTDL